MKLLTFKEHFLELKARLLRVIFIYIIFFALSYYFKDQIYSFLITPLANVSNHDLDKIIYTGLAEAFFTYLKLAAFCALVLTLPFISFQIYLFIQDGLLFNEKTIAKVLLFISPVLFWIGGIFVFYFVMPKAFAFFLSFENQEFIIPILLEARISEYVNLIIQFSVGFGIAFQLPIVLILLNLMHIISTQSLINKRRIAIIINFIIGGVLTPPDVISQFALAIPMILLYELSIAICKLIENRGKNARHKMD